MADTIDFPQKLHSTRRDHKLIDGDEIDGEIGIDNLPVGLEHEVEELQARTSDLHAGTVHTGWNNASAAEGGLAVVPGVDNGDVSLAAIRAVSNWVTVLESNIDNANVLIVRIPHGGNLAHYRAVFASANGGTYLDSLSRYTLRGSDADQNPAWDYYRWDVPLSSEVANITLQITGSADAAGSSTFRGNLVLAKVLAALGVDSVDDLGGGASPLIQNAFDGSTGTDTGETQVAGVTIENDNNVLYVIRVRATTEYVTGAALHAQRSGSPLEISTANFYSKGGDDAGKLYRTLDEATAETLEVWKVNDLAAIRTAIEAGGKTDAQIGDAAFSNPPGSLSSAEKLAVRDAIGAGTTAPVAGVAGLRTESIALRDTGQSDDDAELVPAASDPIAVVHPDDDSDPELLSGLSGNDFTVAPGLYLIRAEGQLASSQLGRLEIDLRRASDNEVLAGLSRVSFPNTGINTPEPFSASGYWHVPEATAIHLHLRRYERPFGVEDLTVEFSRLTVEDAVHSVDWYESLSADLAEFDVGKVIYVVGDGLYKVAQNSLPNRFEGYFAEFRYSGSNLRGTSNSDTVYGAHGAFAANPDGSMRAIVAGRDGTLDVLFDKGRYEAVKGSAVAAGDTLRIVWAFADPGSVSQEAGMDTLTYVGENVDGDLKFHAAESSLKDAAVGALWAAQVQQSDGSAFFTHAAHTKHWIELSFGSEDEYARGEIGRTEERLEAIESELERGLHHIRTSRGELVEDTPDPAAADAPPLILLSRRSHIDLDIPAASRDNTGSAGTARLPNPLGEYSLTTHTADELSFVVGKFEYAHANDTDYTDTYGLLLPGNNIRDLNSIFGIHNHIDGPLGKPVHLPGGYTLGGLVIAGVRGGSGRLKSMYLPHTLVDAWLPDGIGRIQMHSFNVHFRLSDDTTSSVQILTDGSLDVRGGVQYYNFIEHSSADTNPLQAAYELGSNDAARTVDVWFSLTTAGGTISKLSLGGGTKAYTPSDPDLGGIAGKLPVISTNIREIVSLANRAAYDAIGTKDPNTMYVVANFGILVGTQSIV